MKEEEGAEGQRTHHLQWVMQLLPCRHGGETAASDGVAITPVLLSQRLAILYRHS